MALEDRLPLGGIQPSYLESRADINKALPFEKDGNGVTIGWCSATQGPRLHGNGKFRSGSR
jgi:hypothetical protein